MPAKRHLTCLALAAALLLPGLSPSSEAHATEAEPREASSEPLEEVELFLADGVSGMLALPPGAADRQSPAVIMLPDTLGGDRRAAIYTDQLLGAGFAVLDIVTLSGTHGLALALDQLAQHPRVAGQPVGLLGFGAGARIAAAWPGHAAARVLLYPGCTDLDREALHGQAVLVLHGAQDAANAPPDCARLVEAFVARGVAARSRAYPGAGYAWDYHEAAGEGTVLLPRPNGAGRVAAAPWPALTEQAAAEVAAFFAVNFFGPLR